MKNRITLICSLLLLISGTIYSQRANIVSEAITPRLLDSLGITTGSVSTGLHVIPKETYAYFLAQNIGGADPILSASFELIQKPNGSSALIEPGIDPNRIMIKADLTGTYTLQLTINTSAGSDDTSYTFYASNFVGVGNFENVGRAYPNCMTCHENHPRFVEIFNRWKDSDHATMFKRRLTSGRFYSMTCVKCHTTGSDNTIQANNNGFDDVAESLGWTFTPPTSPGKWDTLVNQYTPLVQFATIGCESCHGPGSEHAMGANPAKIAMTAKAGSCGQCHDSPPRYNKYAQWMVSPKSDPVWTGSFAQGASSQNNSLQNCIRCHDGQGYINFTKGRTTNTTGMVQASHVELSCATCHDPHGNDNMASLRLTPAGSDTLANGYSYGDFGGSGNMCFDCHKARQSGITYAASTVSNFRWGPHYSVQGDILLGENAAVFDTPYLTGPHKFAVSNSCVGCHMAPVNDTTSVNMDRLGGHTFKLFDEETGDYHTESCENCHGPKNSWDDFTARYDYDGNGLKESIPSEVEGLMHNLARALPPVGVDSISWEALRDSNNVLYNKAYFNYRLLYADGSKGMHNTTFTIDVLRKSTAAIGGFVTDVPAGEVDVPGLFTLYQNYPNPFNPSTTIKYYLPNESNVKLNIYNIRGELVANLTDGYQSAGEQQIIFKAANLASGVYFYTIEVNPVNGGQPIMLTKKIVLMK